MNSAPTSELRLHIPQEIVVDHAAHTIRVDDERFPHLLSTDPIAGVREDGLATLTVTLLANRVTEVHE